MDQSDQDRDLDEWPDDSGEGDTGCDAEDGDSDGNGQLEVIARGGECECGTARIIGTHRPAHEETDGKH